MSDKTTPTVLVGIEYDVHRYEFEDLRKSLNAMKPEVARAYLLAVATLGSIGELTYGSSDPRDKHLCDCARIVANAVQNYDQLRPHASSGIPIITLDDLDELIKRKHIPDNVLKLFDEKQP